MSKTIATATYWHDATPGAEQAPSTFPVRRTLWARVPWKGRLGRYVALQATTSLILVGIADSPRMRWVDASKALTEAELHRWLKGGF